MHKPGCTWASGTAGSPNSGGGGGGGYSCALPGRHAQAGGSGIVIISYISATQKGTGGAVTPNGGTGFNHTFTTSSTYIA